MAKLRKAAAYRRVKRPYTRKSKKIEKSYVRGAPYSKIVTFDIGNDNGEYTHRVILTSKNNAQIRHNALESARIAVNKILAKNIGVQNYHFKIKPYPHHVVRENPLAAGAGADRFQTGMSHSFGKPVSVAAQVRDGQELMVVETTKKFTEVAKKALKQAIYKFPVRGHIEVEELAE